MCWFLQLFTTDTVHLDDSDEGNDDLSDSEESVFSGLEDSGSDDESDDDDEEADINENGKSTSEAGSIETSTKTAGKPQVRSITFKRCLLVIIFSVFYYTKAYKSLCFDSRPIV